MKRPRKIRLGGLGEGDERTGLAGLRERWRRIPARTLAGVVFLVVLLPLLALAVFGGGIASSLWFRIPMAAALLVGCAYHFYSMRCPNCGAIAMNWLTGWQRRICRECGTRLR